MTMNTKIILIRHAQSEKNIKDIHGGDGESLTVFGKIQAECLTERLSKIGANQKNAWLVYPENTQTLETAQIIATITGIPTHNISDFKPLHLGVVHGLSNEVVARKYPKCFELLVRWRNKDLEICDLCIPGMEAPDTFYNRGIDVLKSIKEGCYNIFVATNSLYILLLNILFGNTCKRGGDYKHFDIPNCGITIFEKNTTGNYVLNMQLSDVEDVIRYGKTKGVNW